VSTRHVNNCTPVKPDINLGPPRVGWRNLLAHWLIMGVLAFFVGIIAIERLAYAEDAPFVVPFDVTVVLAWEEYEETTETLSVKADGDSINCHHTKEKTSDSISIPFSQTVRLTESHGKHCEEHYASYKKENGDWTRFVDERLDFDESAQLQLKVHARNDRDGGWVGLECRSCTVTAKATFNSGEPILEGATNTLSLEILSDKVIPLEKKRFTISPNIDHPKRIIRYDTATCEVKSSNDDVSVSCTKDGKEFVLKAKIDNEAPTVTEPSPANNTVLEKLAPVTLSWTGNDAEHDFLSYNVFFGSELVCGKDIKITTCVVAVDKLSLDAEYLWYV